jgi:hypothetical protein
LSVTVAFASFAPAWKKTEQQQIYENWGDWSSFRWPFLVVMGDEYCIVGAMAAKSESYGEHPSL